MLSTIIEIFYYTPSTLIIFIYSIVVVEILFLYLTVRYFTEMYNIKYYNKNII